MSATKAALLLSLLVLFTTCVLVDTTPKPSLTSQYVPIPKKYPGLFMGPPDAPVNIELVYDPTCTSLPTQATAALSSTT